MSAGHSYREVLPFAAMVMVECTNVGLSTLYKAAVSKGLSYHVFMVYSYAISSLLLLPLSYIFHIKTALPPFTVGLMGRFFVLGLLGFIAQYLGYKGIAYSSPTLGSAMSNLTPATTFHPCSPPQSKAVMDYPAELIVVFFYNLFSCIVSTPVCLITEPNLSAWKVKPNVGLISILYSGIIGSGFGTIVHTWGLHVKGPVYVALLRPLSISIAAILGVIFLGDNLYLGRFSQDIDPDKETGHWVTRFNR
ncbi:WAT1-related protein [Abeliophyllum distichum]|uniref:WAT1-related protein n=1 Tax=Abeliophyllum distichum TaxID=126358 RepID=A0ABD1SH14_9LAMI